MRLATGWVNDATVVYVGVGGDRFVTTDLLAERYGQAWLAGVGDVRAPCSNAETLPWTASASCVDGADDLEGQALDTIELAAPVLDPQRSSASVATTPPTSPRATRRCRSSRCCSPSSRTR